MTHICVSKLIFIGSDNGLSPGPHEAIIWTDDGILLFGPLATSFREIIIEIQTFSLKKLLLKMSGKWRPFCRSLNVLNNQVYNMGKSSCPHKRRDLFTHMNFNIPVWLNPRWGRAMDENTQIPYFMFINLFVRVLNTVSNICYSETCL